MEYPKTENLYARDPETHKVGPEYGFRQPEVGLISRWLVTEKVDGMNMRVVWTPQDNFHRVPSFYGRTDRANIPGDLLDHMQETFTVEQLREVFGVVQAGEAEITFPNSVILFGEGFGPGIQGAAGQAYGGEKRFILFDVVVNGGWLRWEDVEDVGCALGVPTVPVLCEGCTLDLAKEVVEHSELLPHGSQHIEGIVARTEPPLFDRRGRRVGFKYKVRDL